MNRDGDVVGFGTYSIRPGHVTLLGSRRSLFTWDFFPVSEPRKGPFRGHAAELEHIVVIPSTFYT
jgi:hypothetical protein